MSCDCTHLFDCPCRPPDPDPHLEENKLYCANCFGAIGDCCKECAPTLVSKRERKRWGWD